MQTNTTSCESIRENIQASCVAPHDSFLSTTSCIVSMDGSYFGTVNVDAKPPP